MRRAAHSRGKRLRLPHQPVQIVRITALEPGPQTYSRAHRLLYAARTKVTVLCPGAIHGHGSKHASVTGHRSNTDTHRRCLTKKP
ncbi:hypothetical protein EV184_103322 [Sinorhizobium americanum]|uniref:Uncharacterized protein n=1 Tax=Sinorhizobium americanum TaxID=194963 RepID=A0A4R2BZ56_9HYPH|nr:hypothetical protein EV184_103322 [Sinorhizobium americanum]